MQNWDSLQPANYDLNWYSNMFSGSGVKNESHSPTSASIDHQTCFNSLKHQTSAMDTNSPSSSPKNDECNQDTNYIDTNNCNGIILNNNHQRHHPLGFNPLTPPGLPNAVLPSMNFQSDITHDTQMQIRQGNNDVKTEENSLTPRNTPPVDVTPPKSPKPFNNNNESLDIIRDNDMVSNSSEDTRFLESEDDELIRVPIYNSHGKMKNYKCKHCGFLAITKISFWNHAREHIKPEKMLQCPKCPFVTELKHHLEYHIRKHKNLKPFQCDKCNYSCVNKSMLNSHLKSHSSVYQYRCSDCDYATKYCHSFKLHLRKYDHKPGMVLDEDGTPNPSVVIDVYGTRRGPKMKSGKVRSKSDVKREVDFESQTSFPMDKKSAGVKGISVMNNNNNNGQIKTSNSPNGGKCVGNVVPSLLPNNIANMFQQTRNMPFLPYFNLNLQMIAAQQHAAWTQMSPQMQQTVFRSSGDYTETNNVKDSKGLSDEEDNNEQKCDPVNGAMDLSQTTVVKANVLIQSEMQSSQDQDQEQATKSKEDQGTPTITSSSVKRKTRLFKTDKDKQPIENSRVENQEKSIAANEMDLEEENDEDNDNDNENKSSKNCATLETRNELPSSSQDDIKLANCNNEHHQIRKTSTSSTSSSSADSNTSSSQIISQIPGIFECKYCDIYFKDAVLYTIHMGYHSCDDVFKCNMCGEKCDGPVGLFIHMARNAHS